MHSTSKKHPQVDSRSHMRSSVLVVEDEIIVRLMLAQNLRDFGYNVIEASNADEALTVFEVTRPDIIVTDLRMPGSIDGMGLCATVRTYYPDLPVVIVSGHLDAQTVETDPHTLFLPKPCSIVELVEVVQTQLEN